MAGRNPYRLHSFAELRAVFGPLWVRCDRCRRFRRLPVTRALRDRDHRTTRFTCRRCGGQGYCALERPDTEPGREDYVEDRRRPVIDREAMHARLKAVFPWFNDAEWAWHYEPVADGGAAYRIARAPADAFGELAIWMPGAPADHLAAVQGWLIRALNPARLVPATSETGRIEGKSRPGGHGNALS